MHMPNAQALPPRRKAQHGSCTITGVGRSAWFGGVSRCCRFANRQRNWRAYPQGNSNSKNGAGPKGRRSLGHMYDGGIEWPGRSSAGTSRIARAWANSVTTVKPLAKPRVGDDSSVERLRERQEAAGNGLNNQNERGGCLLFARRNGSAASYHPDGACQATSSDFSRNPQAGHAR
jgi:hypothetical protein